MDTETHEHTPTGGYGTFRSGLGPSGSPVTPPPRLVVSGDGDQPEPGPRFGQGRAVIVRDVEPHDIAAKLRGMLGLDPETPAPGELAASFDRPLPPTVERLDVGGWIGWCMTGVPLFGGGFPRLAEVRREAKRTVLVLALLREYSISGAERLLGSHRKIVRENMKLFGIYPWPATLRRVLAALRACAEGGQS